MHNIKGHDQIELCNNTIKELAVIMDTAFKENLKKSITITSGYRPFDKGLHGQGKAFDFTIPYIHVITYAPIAYSVAMKFSRSVLQVTSFGVYEGIDPVDKEWKTHIHLDIMGKRDFMSVYTGVYKDDRKTRV